MDAFRHDEGPYAEWEDSCWASMNGDGDLGVCVLNDDSDIEPDERAAMQQLAGRI